MNARQPPASSRRPSRSADGGLAVARARLAALGFTVAPIGIHPFGTANCCVFLADGTYLEPLAVADAAAARDRHCQLATSSSRVTRCSGRSPARRASRPWSCRTDDAAADHDRFEQANMSAGSMLDFSRAFVDPQGNSAVASFRLAFAAEALSRGAFAFSCQRINPPPSDRTVLQTHANGAVALSSIVAVSDDPANIRSVPCRTSPSDCSLAPEARPAVIPARTSVARACDVRHPFRTV